MFVQADLLVPTINGTEGVFLAARLDRGGCSYSNSKGIFFVIYPRNSSFIVSSNISKLLTGEVNIFAVVNIVYINVLCMYVCLSVCSDPYKQKLQFHLNNATNNCGVGSRPSTVNLVIVRPNKIN